MLPPVLASLIEALGSGNLSVFDLEQPRSAGGWWHPVQHPGFHYGLHRRHADQPKGRSSASGIIVMADHYATHVDALSHQAYEGTMFGGIRAPLAEGPGGFSELGAESIPAVIRRGVLIDLASNSNPPGAEALITMADIEEATNRQSLECRQGDVVLVRTGWGRHWLDGRTYGKAPGMASEVSSWLASQGVHAVGADNMAWDLVGHRDKRLGEFPGHVLLLVQRGIYIYENMLLEELGKSGCDEFLFVSAPLKFVGATAGPARPLAIGGVIS